MAERLLKTANFWAEQAGESDKDFRNLLAGREPDGWRGKTQPLFYLSTVLDAMRGATAQGAEALDPIAERARKDKEAADKLALENAQTRGDLASISVMAKSFADAVVTTKALLLAIPTKEARTVAAMNDANAVEHRLRNTINDALRQLAAYGTGGAGERCAGDGESDGDVRATTTPDRKRVGRGKQATQ